MKKIRFAVVDIVKTSTTFVPFFSGVFMPKNAFDSPTSKLVTL